MAKHTGDVLVIAAAAETQRLTDLMARLAPDEGDGGPCFQASLQRMQVAAEAIHMPASTPAGWRAKALILLHQLAEAGSVGSDPETEMSWAFVHDVLGLPLPAVEDWP